MIAYKIENGFVLVPEKDFEELCNDSAFLWSLEAAGVDNWEGYDLARKIMEEENKEEED
jgi:hypothetical protein